MNKTIDEIEHLRVLLQEKKKFFKLKIVLSIFPLLVVLPFILGLSILYSALFAVFFSLFFSRPFAITEYNDKISKPFNQLKHIYFRNILTNFLNEYHPGVKLSVDNRLKLKWTILGEKIKKLKQDIKSNYILKYDGIVVTVAEVKFSRPTFSTEQIVFTGNVINLKLAGKSFPESDIISTTNFPVLIDKNIHLATYKSIEDTNLKYKTTDNNEFEKKIIPIISLINQLSNNIGGIRVLFKKSKIIILVNKNEFSIDDTNLSLEESFLDKSISQKLARKINTILLIADSLKNELQTTEVEERLELKMLEKIKNREIDE